VREGWDSERKERKQSESSVEERRESSTFDLHLNKVSVSAEDAPVESKVRAHWRFVFQRRTPSGTGGDPRERVKKEQDGIVLSPERRSFKLGCYVTPTTHSQDRDRGPGGPGRRPESPLGNKPDRWGQIQLPSSRRPESPVGAKNER